jgi:lipoyl(octanoyl) transferase
MTPETCIETDRNGVEWHVSADLVPYPEAVALMEERAARIAAQAASEAIWLLEHPPLYTAGTSARPADLTDPDRFPVFETRRGGQYTYHGPGQRVVYVMLDVGRRGRDVRRFVQQLEAWVIATLAEFNVTGEIREGRVGVWVARDDKPLSAAGEPAEDKIAAIGIRLRRWVSFHGLSINVEPDLGHFSGIVPCGITGHGVTSLVDLGLPVTMDDLDVALRRCFDPVFATGAAARQT